jgi:primosomal protein N'
MKILRINRQHRRDFWADYICEHCEKVVKDKSGYDDTNFHQNVIPAMKCPKCGKTAGDDYRPMTTKYPDDRVV